MRRREQGEQRRRGLQGEGGRDDEQRHGGEQTEGDATRSTGDRAGGEALIDGGADGGAHEVHGEDVGKGVDGVLEVLREDLHAHHLEADTARGRPRR